MLQSISETLHEHLSDHDGLPPFTDGGDSEWGYPNGDFLEEGEEGGGEEEGASDEAESASEEASQPQRPWADVVGDNAPDTARGVGMQHAGCASNRSKTPDDKGGN